ncbi:hypothetical protein ROA7450_01243 [Roseovarius albus]|uniref:Uncharacterized protein n=1 Tax=Roseovarius albus TaxID=1247867 RepID=A0A1X6YRU4_9RHOB|nr:hypothetical protein ROA7450_01243 [Roseovarius albus]
MDKRRLAMSIAAFCDGAAKGINISGGRADSIFFVSQYCERFDTMNVVLWNYSDPPEIWIRWANCPPYEHLLIKCALSSGLFQHLDLDMCHTAAFVVHGQCLGFEEGCRLVQIGDLE